jgi:myo-inositol 2-dehydrogenase/D-chiro-inositol 1-dehydrogenase
VRVGLAGAGRIGAFHAEILRENPLVNGITVADADPERAGRVAAAVGAGCVAAPEELPEAGIDALVIAAATPAHAPLIELAAETGLPCFCEKPIALDLATTDAVLDHVRRAGILLQVGFQRRFDAGYRAAREAVRSGAIGELYLVRLAGHDPKPPPEEYVAASGGIFADLAVHDFDIAAWVLGRPVVEVYADGVTSNPLFARHGDVDVAAAVLRFEGGVMGVLSAARTDPRGYDIRMELFGSRDSVAVGLSARTPLRSLEPGVPAPAEDGWRDFMERFKPAYRAELQGFLESARDGGPSLCGGEEARRAFAVALAADRSRSERRPVAVAEVG